MPTILISSYFPEVSLAIDKENLFNSLMTLRFDPRVMLFGEIGCQSLLGVKRLKKLIYIKTFLALRVKNPYFKLALVYYFKVLLKKPHGVRFSSWFVMCLQ